MDPNLFRIDWEVLAEVLTTVVVLSFFVERALSLLFEHRWFVKRLNEKGLKEPISFIVSFLTVRYWEFDSLSILLHREEASLWGYALTAAIVAGGSKASIKLFHDLLDVKSSAVRQGQRALTTEKDT